jgi:DNA-binding PadR family transcriptional regulator
MTQMIILGLLHKGPHTGYEVQKRMEGTTDFFYSTSAGSIHPAFKKLEEASYVTAHSAPRDGRNRKVFTITETGRAAFLDWLGKDIALARIKEDVLVKLFFFEHLNGEERTELMKRHIAQLRQVHGILSEMHRDYSHCPEGERPSQFQLMTIHFGIDYYQFAADWYEKQLEELA